ncbi:MAG: hypothetical protein Q8L23_06415 [Caulobacter sp.]|nr:hypothetical protein [Caulobacter sp.]
MTKAVRSHPALVRRVVVAVVVAATGLALPSAPAALPSIPPIPFPYMITDLCSASDPDKTRQTLNQMLRQLEAVQSEHEETSLQLAVAWRADGEMLLRLNAANDTLNSILGARTSAAHDPRRDAADRLLKEAERAVARRMALVGAFDLAETWLRDTIGQPTYGRRDARVEVNRARQALTVDENTFGNMEHLLGMLAVRRAERTTAQYPGLSEAQTRTIGQAYLERARVEAGRTVMLAQIEDLRARVRSSYLSWRLMQAWEPQIRSCLATLQGAPAAPAGPPIARDPADRTGPIDIVQVQPKMVEFTSVSGSPKYAGSLGMTLVFHPGGAVSGTVLGGARVRGRWGGGVAEGEITGLPRDRVAHWRFTDLRLEKVNYAWTLKSDGLWCTEETGLSNEERASGRYRFWGYIAAPGSSVVPPPPALPQPPNEALTLCDRPWQG